MVKSSLKRIPRYRRSHRKKVRFIAILLSRGCIDSRLTRLYATAMDIDATGDIAQRGSSKKSGRIQKRGRQKAKSSMVFPVYKKGRRVMPRAKQRK